MKAANQGCPDAQFQVGKMLENGIGVDKDRVQAILWYKKAAEQDYEEAVERLKTLE
jgi:TPR repeat protein